MSKFFRVLFLALTTSIASCGGAYAQDAVYGNVGVDTKVVNNGVVNSNQPSVYGQVGVKSSYGVFADVTARTLSTQNTAVVDPRFATSARLGYATTVGTAKVSTFVTRNSYFGVAGTSATASATPASFNDTWVGAKLAFMGADTEVDYRIDDNQNVHNRDVVMKAGYTLVPVAPVSVRGGLTFTHYNGQAHATLYNGVDIKAVYALTSNISTYAQGHTGGHTYATTLGLDQSGERSVANSIVLGANYKF